MHELIYIPPVRINKRYENLMSNWFSVSNENSQTDFLKYNIEYRSESLCKESTAHFIVVEISDGSYLRLSIASNKLIKSINLNNKLKYDDLNIKFSFVPRTYCCQNKMYLFFVELRAQTKRRNGSEYYFVAENLVFKYSELALISKSQYLGHALLEPEFEDVKFLKIEKNKKKTSK